jgi:hypothetical protein
MKLAVFLAAIAVLAVPQEKPGDCDLIKVEERNWCPVCRVFPDDAALNAAGKVHERCGTAVESKAACVKSAFPCTQHGAGQVLHSRRCCPVNIRDCCNEVVVLAKVEYKCLACGARGVAPDQVMHGNDRGREDVVPVCPKSGTFPHGGTAFPAFGAPKP